MKRFVQGFLLLVGAIFALIVVAAAPAILFFIAFIVLCWGIGRLAFGKAEPKPKATKSSRGLITPTKDAIAKTSSILTKVASVTNEKVIRPAFNEAKTSYEAKKKLRTLEQELEAKRQEKEFEEKLKKKAEEGEY